VNGSTTLRPGIVLGSYPASRVAVDQGAHARVGRVLPEHAGGVGAARPGGWAAPGQRDEDVFGAEHRHEVGLHSEHLGGGDAADPNAGQSPPRPVDVVQGGVEGAHLGAQLADPAGRRQGVVADRGEHRIAHRIGAVRPGSPQVAQPLGAQGPQSAPGQHLLEALHGALRGGAGHTGKQPGNDRADHAMARGTGRRAHTSALGEPEPRRVLVAPGRVHAGHRRDVPVRSPGPL